MSKRWYWLAPALRPNHLPKWRGRYLRAWCGVFGGEGTFGFSVGPAVVRVSPGELVAGLACSPVWWLRLTWAA